MRRAESQVVNLFETGLYTVADVSRLTNVHPARISRWVKGYSYASSKGMRQQEAVWEPEIPAMEGATSLSFNDLLEIRFVHEFREAGVALSKKRSTVIALRKETQTKYPFSRRMIFTDGKGLFEKLHDENGRPLLIELSTKHKHYSFFNVTLPYLRKGLIFDERGVVRRWYPDKEKYRSIVVDPMISFGRPVIEGTRINSSVLAVAVTAERPPESVAEWFGIETDLVRQAISFHQKYKAA